MNTNLERQLRDRLSVAPDDLNTYKALAEHLVTEGRHADAIDILSRAADRKNVDSNLVHYLGWILATVGRTPDAIGQLQRALQLDPANAAAHYLLSTLHRYQPGDPHLAQMQRVVKSHDLSARDRSRVFYAIGRAQEQLGDYDDAFASYKQANELRYATSAYSPLAAEAMINRTINAFTSDAFEQFAGAGLASRLPVFIVGMPRSGSSLVEQIVASHSMCAGAGEIVDLVQHHQATVAPVTLSEQPWPENLRNLPASVWQQIGSQYTRSLQSRFPEAAHIIDKQLLNYALLGVIHLSLPQAPIIHCVRDPLDTCVSCYATAFKNDYYGFTCDLEQLGRAYRLYQAMMAHWTRVLPGRVLTVRYEELVADPERQIRRVLDHIGVEWESQCLAFYDTKRPVATSSRGQVTQPIYGSSIDRWRKFESYLGPLIAALGDPG